VTGGQQSADPVALVTSGGSGAGAAIVRTLHAAGVRVAVGERPRGDAERTALPEACSVHEGFLAVATDCERVVKEVIARHGRLDHLVCLAMRRGFTVEQPVERADAGEWDRTLAAYLSGPYYLIRAALGQMLEQRSGRIVVVVPSDGGPGSVGQAAVGVAATGLVTLAQRVAREVAGRGVTVNAVMSGLVASPWVGAEMPPEFADQLAAVVPAGRLADPDELGRAVAFLCSPDAGYITGQVLGVDGGLRA
jgi:NAD(P)-dependent dehydrogenase (short-subunit alcohol dehydrogenase family)